MEYKQRQYINQFILQVNEMVEIGCQNSIQIQTNTCTRTHAHVYAAEFSAIIEIR